jgi:hypothetical protein
MRNAFAVCVVVSALFPVESVAQADTRQPRAALIAGCYSLGDSTNSPVGRTFGTRIELDTTQVTVHELYGIKASAIYGVRSMEPLDSTAERSRHPLARLIAVWYFVGTDSVVLHTQGKFTKHQLRFRIVDGVWQGTQKYETDLYDRSNPFRWTPATARKVNC